MKHELKITRDIDVPREKLFRGWSDVDLMEQWFCPLPWRTRDTVLDPRPGGRMEMVMFGPDGETQHQKGVFLEFVPNERIVFTDAYRAGWEPAAEPFMTAVVTFEDLGGGRTRYTASCRHWTAEACQRHAEMGFEPGWNAALDQLIALAAKL
jgi:uncharacterized protein YndB with AHSA1/START domain